MFSADHYFPKNFSSQLVEFASINPWMWHSHCARLIPYVSWFEFTQRQTPWRGTESKQVVCVTRCSHHNSTRPRWWGLFLILRREASSFTQTKAVTHSTKRKPLKLYLASLFCDSKWVVTHVGAECSVPAGAAVWGGSQNIRIEVGTLLEEVGSPGIYSWELYLIPGFFLPHLCFLFIIKGTTSDNPLPSDTLASPRAQK